MKKLFLFMIILLAVSCGKKAAQTEKMVMDSVTNKTETQTTVFTDKVQFPESTLPYDGGILVANFGGTKLNPTNTDGKGYILYLKNDTLNDFIPADGNLNAPKGMYIIDNHLFIADVNRVAVYDLNDKSAKPQLITFPKNEVLLNDLAAKGDTLYTSVSNTGNIYRLIIKDVNKIDNKSLKKYTNVSGVNGITIDGNKMFLVSFPAKGGNPTDRNVVYVINDMKNPKPEKLITKSGTYDGVQLSDDKNTLYVSNWTPSEIIGINLNDKSVTTAVSDSTIKSIADFTLYNNKFYIPDLSGSKLFIRELK